MEHKDGYVIVLEAGQVKHSFQRVAGEQDLLRYLQQSVDGHIEIVRPVALPKSYVMVVNDCGLLQELPYNPLGSYLYGTPKHHQPIVGTAVILKEIMTDDGPDLGLLSLEDYSHVLYQIYNAYSWCEVYV